MLAKRRGREAWTIGVASEELEEDWKLERLSIDEGEKRTDPELHITLRTREIGNASKVEISAVGASTPTYADLKLANEKYKRWHQFKTRKSCNVNGGKTLDGKSRKSVPRDYGRLSVLSCNKFLICFPVNHSCAAATSCITMKSLLQLSMSILLLRGLEQTRLVRIPRKGCVPATEIEYLCRSRELSEAACVSFSCARQ